MTLITLLSQTRWVLFQQTCYDRFPGRDADGGVEVPPLPPKTKQNKTKQNKTKQNKTKQNKTKQNQNKTKQKQQQQQQQQQQ